jgi:uncharacterized protein involved in outer membrane biogenesis
MKISHPDLGALMKAQGSDMLTGGPVDITVDVKGKGNSVAAIMASLNGEFVLEMGKAEIHNEWAQRAMTGVVEVVTERGKTQPVDLNCVVGDFNISDGVARPTSLVVNTPTLSLFGDGRIDLRDETLHLEFDRLASGASASGALPPFKLEGTLASPSGSVDAGALGSKLVGYGASLVTGGDRRRRVGAKTGPERCRQMLVVYRKLQEDREESKKETKEAVVKGADTMKEATKTGFGKVRGLFKRKK